MKKHENRRTNKGRIKKHKERITHPFSERSNDEKICSWIIATLEWVLGEE